MEGPVVPASLEEGLEEFGGIEGLKRYRPDPSVISRLEKVYELLSSKGRIEIVYFLNFSPLTPGMLTFLTGMAPNLLSFHLRKLSSSGVIRGVRDGKFVVYEMTEMGRSLSGPLSRGRAYDKL